MLLKKIHAIIFLLVGLSSFAVAQPPQNKPADQDKPLPLTTIGVTAAAEFLEREDDHAQALLRIHLDGKTLQFTPQDVHHQFNGEVAITVYEPSGKVSESSAEALRLTLTEQ